MSDSTFFTGQEYIEPTRNLVNKIYKKTPKACVVTYGCQQNVSDSQQIKGMLKDMGYELCENTDEADFIL